MLFQRRYQLAYGGAVRCDDDSLPLLGFTEVCGQVRLQFPDGNLYLIICSHNNLIVVTFLDQVKR